MASVTPPSGSGKQPKPTSQQMQDAQQPGNVDSKTSKEVSETAGAQGASQQASTALADGLKALLEKEFGKKVGDDAYAIIEKKLKSGKPLTYAMVKESVLEAAKKDNVTVSDKKFKELEQGMKEIKQNTQPQTPKPSDSGYKLTYYDPSQLFKVEREARQNLDRFMAMLEDSKFAALAKEQMMLKAEIDAKALERDQLAKDVGIKSPRPPKDTV